MPFEEGLFEYLDNHPGLSREVDSRIYALKLPQRVELPAVTYQRVSTPRLLAFQRSFLPHPRFQFKCWAGTFPRARNVAEQVVAALNIYMGAMGDYTVQVSIVEDDRDIYEPVTKLYTSLVEVVIWHES